VSSLGLRAIGADAGEDLRSIEAVGGTVVSGQWAVAEDRRMQKEEGGKGSHNPLSRGRPHCHAIGGALFLGAIYS
jgi:hypothetical protein